MTDLTALPGGRADTAFPGFGDFVASADSADYGGKRVDGAGRRDPGSVATAFDVALANIGWLRPAERQKLKDSFDGVEGEFVSLGFDDLCFLVGRVPRTPSWDAGRELETGMKLAAYCASWNIRVIGQGDAEYPPLLREIPGAPFLLFARGCLPDPERPSLAIVGTRDPSAKAWGHTLRVAGECARSGFCVVSGLARGIDRAAHEGAVSGGGKTVAVLGTGIDFIYPREHRALASRILETGGGILSEYPPGWTATKWRFPERNRIISGLSRSVLVAQAPRGSGALITSDFALEQGRDLQVLSSGIEGERGAGTRALADDGAPVVDCLEDIVSAWF